MPELSINTVIILVLALVVVIGLAFFASKALTGSEEELWFWKDWAILEVGKTAGQNIVYLGDPGDIGTGATVDIDEVALVSPNSMSGYTKVKIVGTNPSAGTVDIEVGDPVYLTLHEGEKVSIDVDNNGVSDINLSVSDITENDVVLVIGNAYPSEACRSNVFRCVDYTGEPGSYCNSYCSNLGLNVLNSYIVDCDSTKGLEVCCSCEGFPLPTTTTTTTIPTTPTTIPPGHEYERGYWEIRVRIPQSAPTGWPVNPKIRYTPDAPNSWWMVKPIYNYTVAYQDILSLPIHVSEWGRYDNKYLTFQLFARYQGSGVWLIDMNIGALAIDTDDPFFEPNDVWYHQVLDVCPHPFMMRDEEWRWRIREGVPYSTPPWIYHTDLLYGSGTTEGYWPPAYVDVKYAPPNKLPDGWDISRMELTVNGENWVIRVYPNDNKFDRLGILRDFWVPTG